MRTREEVGYLTNYGEKVNEAYLTYASLYLDFVDDNYSHFTWRDIDIRPLRNAKSEDEEDVYKSYTNEAVDLAKIAITSGYYSSYKQLYNDYPFLEAFDKELAAIIWEI